VLRAGDHLEPHLVVEHSSSAAAAAHGDSGVGIHAALSTAVGCTGRTQAGLAGLDWPMVARIDPSESAGVAAVVAAVATAPLVAAAAAAAVLRHGPYCWGACLYSAALALALVLVLGSKQWCLKVVLVTTMLPSRVLAAPHPSLTSAVGKVSG